MIEREIDFSKKIECIDEEFKYNIIQAIENNDSDRLQKVINSNVDHTLDINISSSETLLMKAINKNDNLAMILIENGANVNLENVINTSFPLFEIAKKEKIKLGMFVISKGANISKKNKNGIRALDITSSTSNFKKIIDQLQRSDIPFIMMRDSLINHDMIQFESALAFKSDLSLFKYNNKNIFSFALIQNVNHDFFIKLVETGCLEKLNNKEINQILYYYKEGFGHVNTRNLLRYGFVSKILNKGVL